MVCAFHLARRRAGLCLDNELLADKPHRIVDNLPGATSFVTVDKTKKYYAAGFKLGFYENDVSPTFTPSLFPPPANLCAESIHQQPRNSSTPLA